MQASTSRSSARFFTPDAPLHLLVIGGGLCGLGAAIATRLAGHRVTVLEAVSSLQEVGAGLQLTPNGVRLLEAWGLTADLADVVTTADYIRMRRYDGRLLAERINYAAEIRSRYGVPIWCLHRADLQNAMVARAVALGAEILLNKRVEKVDGEKAKVVLADGEQIEADIILGADGLWSTTRDALQETAVRPEPTGDLAYRILLDGNRIVEEDLKKWLMTPGINIWLGPGAHVVAYAIKGGRWLNLVLLVPDNLPENVRKAEGNLDEMKALFEEWDPNLRRFLQYTSKVEKWRLHYLAPIPRWKTEEGSYLIAGDCAHAMLPYMSQGANSALEDGATIGALLARVQRKDQIPAAMQLYDAIRRPRVDELVSETFAQGKEHHLPDGDEQVKRDSLLARSMEATESTNGKLPWTHPKIQPWIFGYDAYEEVGKAYRESPF